MRTRNCYMAIPRRFNSCIYAAELKNGVIKVGFSRNPRTRMCTLAVEVKRNLRSAILRWHISPNIPDAKTGRNAEAALLARMRQIGNVLAGRQEYFKDVSFGAAVTLVNQMARPVATSMKA